MTAFPACNPANTAASGPSGKESRAVRMIAHTAGILALGLVVTGCGGGAGNDGGAAALPFKARLSEAGNPRSFTVSVAAGEAGLDDVRESVRFEATEHCLYEFGSSDTKWETDPETGDWAYTQDGGGLVFSGRCTAR